MTATEYALILRKAKIDSIEQRWIPLSKGANYDDVPTCQICKVTQKLKMFNLLDCTLCPMHDEDTDCCKEYENFKFAYYDRVYGEVHAASIAVIARIDAIDVEAWTRHLVEEGVLSDDQST